MSAGGCLNLDVIGAMGDPRACAFGITPFGPAIAFEAINLAIGVRDDIRHGTTRNTAEAAVGAAAGAAGAITGAVAGAEVGATIGTFVCPGPGTIIGGGVGATVGATFGCVAGDHYARGVASDFFDGRGYNISELVCQNCDKKYLCRVYTDQSRKYCRDCDGKAKDL